MAPIPEIFKKPYNPQEHEATLYKTWETSDIFNPDTCFKRGIVNAEKEPFSMVLPPPNATGTLHTGHALMLAIEDIMTRFSRMQGRRTLWLPGTDHASIATEAKVAKILEKDGKRKHELGREAFLEEVATFVEGSRGTIRSQLRRMGASLDWSREAFTLDTERQQAVTSAFKQLYDLGLIYRGYRIVNWDPKGQTVISDDEIVRREEQTNFYYLKYGPFVIGTARPETKFGDKYVVMHPDDPRYQEYTHGQTIDLEWINGPVTATIIKDEAIDMEFGTGVMTITPWHDTTDFDIAERHNLEKEQIIDQYGKLLPIAQEFAGMKITDAREKIVEKLKQKGLVEKVDENYTHQIVTAERTGGIIEPQIMEQWFIAVTKPFTLPHATIDGISSGQTVTLKELMLHVVRTGQVTILPEQFEKVYFHWIENLRDWCISRQIWYGHQIPVWYKNDDVHVGEAPTEAGWEQDPDTLDTWFSSGLWTFSTLGWPDKTDDYTIFHPTSVLETGYDILFFWVARMILMSTSLLGSIPFKTVYLHGMVRDEKGRKMSKSLGNIVDPVDLIDRYGADALRMAMIVGNGPGSDLNLGDEKIRAYSKFCNKIWNASRFVLENVPDNFDYQNQPTLSTEDKESLEKLNALINEITKEMDTYKFYLVAEKLYHFFWHEFADVMIEERKNRSDDASAQWTLYHLLTTQLKLLHPFMPFITEAIWQHLPHTDNTLLVIESWPTPYAS